MDGFEVLEQVRAKRCKTPILVLTAVDAVPKILQAFDLGADDYLVKPFILEILLARVGAIARRVATIELPPASAGGVTLAPMDASLEATSARTYISPTFVQNFTTPVADYGEAVAMAPGTFTVNGNGVGLGQSKTYFRGFPDGNYNIDFDGIPFYDTNSPTHHSWAFFPAQFFGGIDLDRSPGTASTVGPTPFGGSIHLLSKDMSPVKNVRGQFAYGSFNTYLYDGQFDSADVLPNKKLNFQIDVHHLQSDGYQTFNYQTRNGGEIKAQYKFSDRTVITGFSGVIWLDANTPNFNAARCQMYGAASGYTCAVCRCGSQLSSYRQLRPSQLPQQAVQHLPCAHRLRVCWSAQ